MFAQAASAEEEAASQAAPAHAAASDTEAGIVIEWRAPKGCPDAASVRLATARILRQKLEMPRRQRIQATATVMRRGPRYWELTLRLSAGDSASEETLAAKHCRALADAVALKVALLADPLAVVHAMETTPREQDEQTEPQAVPNEPKRPQPVVTGPKKVHPETSSRFGIRGAFGLGLGPLPGITPGAGLFPSIDFSHWRGEFGAQLFWGGKAEYPGLDIGAHLQLASAIVRVCATPKTQSLDFPICVGVEGGTMRGKGYGVPDADVAYSHWAAAVIGPALRLPLRSRIALWIEADAVVTLLRPSFRMRNLEELHRAPPGGARIFAGLEYILSE